MITALSIEETADIFCDRPTQSAMRIVHVLFDGTHCVQQQSALLPHSDTHSPRDGITIVIERTLVTLALGNTSEKFQNFAKFRAAAGVFIAVEITK